MGKKFSYIYEGRPKTNSGLFMQSLFLHCIGRCWLPERAYFWTESTLTGNPFCGHSWTIFHLILCPGHLTSQSSLHQRLAGLYCLYCLYECQPYKPQFKIYLSLGKAHIWANMWCTLKLFFNTLNIFLCLTKKCRQLKDVEAKWTVARACTCQKNAK